MTSRPDPRGGPPEVGVGDGGPPIPAVRRAGGRPSEHHAGGRPGARRGIRAPGPPPRLRPGREDDLTACARTWEIAFLDYQRRLNQPAVPGDIEPVRRLLAHLLATDPGRFWVAARPAPDRPDGEEVVAFGSATVRGAVWFLAMLFVLPDAQAAGLGRLLLERTFAGGAPPDTDEAGPGQLAGSTAPTGRTAASGRTAATAPTVFATATDSIQPISNALYARYGIVPRLPVYRFVGRPERPGALPDLPSGIRAVPFDAIAAGPPGGPGHRELVEAVGSIDRELLGYEHPEDHRYLRSDGRMGYLYRGPDGVSVGYGYTSAVGRIGPLAARDGSLFAPIAAHLLRAVEPRGASSIWLPGAAGPAFRMLLEAGLRLEGFPALLCWTRPFASFERYAPSSLALL